MKDFLIALAACVAFFLLQKLFTWLSGKYLLHLSGRHPRLSSGFFLPLFVFWLALNIGMSYYVIVSDQSFLLLVSVLVISSSIFVYFMWKEINQFWRLGIRSADRQIKDGINYLEALKLCHNELKFLGIGAAKLTREGEFENALCRCSPHKPIQLLLCKPSDENLTAAAKRFHRKRDEYQKIVRNSLKKIAELRDKRALNIEVRFYSLNVPIFRLMFIDDSLCLASY